MDGALQAAIKNGKGLKSEFTAQLRIGCRSHASLISTSICLLSLLFSSEVQTNDRSKPAVAGAVAGSGGGGGGGTAKIGSAPPVPGGSIGSAPSGPPALGGLFAGGMPKLKPSGGAGAPPPAGLGELQARREGVRS